MSDMKQTQHEAPASTGAFVAILAVIAIAGVVLMIGSVGNIGSVEVNAAPVALPVPGQVFSPEEHSVLIREGHSRAVLEGDDAPLPPTF